MPYISTRGNGTSSPFSATVLEGLARDGGLYVPESIPDFSKRLDELKSMDYRTLASTIFFEFVDAEFDKTQIEELVNKSYQSFDHEEITPLIHTGGPSILELYHGPTLAFKDVALQFLGNLFEELLHRRNQEMTILGATSGDTGSAAIYGVKGRESIRIFMLHPKGRVSPIQQRQMTTVLDDNVFNIEVEGTFDDCQNMVKQIFNDLQFKDKHRLGAVNSINWARVMAQIVYYFYAAFRFEEQRPGKPLVFSVPTGNFGDVFAGYLAQKMGLPIHKLVLATNENDILCRALQTGSYKTGQVTPTISPSMDIQVASNFERFVFDLVGRNGDRIKELMKDLAEKGEFRLSKDQLEQAQKDFVSARANHAETLEVISRYHQKGVDLDPHTAVGVKAAEKAGFTDAICLATAHPSKFEDAFFEATGVKPKRPKALENIEQKESRCLSAMNDVDEIKRIIEQNSP